MNREKIDTEIFQLLTASDTFRYPFWLAPTVSPSSIFISWAVILRHYLLPLPLDDFFGFTASNSRPSRLRPVQSEEFADVLLLSCIVGGS
jgi:hypothetical protein